MSSRRSVIASEAKQSLLRSHGRRDCFVALRAPRNDQRAVMTLYFAYGSNMSRALMRPRCPSAREIGVAVLAGYRFIITADGYASVVPTPGGIVHGLLWRLTPRDRSALNAYECLDAGLYRGVTLPVRLGGERAAALVYVGRSRA